VPGSERSLLPCSRKQICFLGSFAFLGVAPQHHSKAAEEMISTPLFLGKAFYAQVIEEEG
jgi:hypothetical protein